MGGGAVTEFFAVVDRVIELLRSRGRVSYQALRVQINLDDKALNALKAELISESPATTATDPGRTGSLAAG